MYRFDTLSNSEIIFSFWCVINSFEEEEENEEDIYFAKKKQQEPMTIQNNIEPACQKTPRSTMLTTQTQTTKN